MALTFHIHWDFPRFPADAVIGDAEVNSAVVLRNIGDVENVSLVYDLSGRKEVIVLPPPGDSWLWVTVRITFKGCAGPRGGYDGCGAVFREVR